MHHSQFGKAIRPVFLLYLWVLCFGQAPGQTTQQQIQNADWFTRPLGNGVVWKYYYFDNLFNSRQSISYIEADLSVPGVRLELPYLNGTQRTTTLIKNKFPNAAGGINGTFFSSGGHMTYLKANGTEVPQASVWQGAWAYSGGLVFNRSTDTYAIIRQPASTPSGNSWWENNTGSWTDAIVNGPLLLKNGTITSGQFPSGSHCYRHPRTIVGMKPGNKLLLVVVDGRHAEAAGITCDEMAELMVALGCVDATSLDGGGSSAMYGRGEPNNGLISYPSTNGGYDKDHTDERSVANAIAVMANNATPLPFDARIETLSVPSSITAGQRKYATITYRNIGSQTWTSNRVTITTSRPIGRVSLFYDADSWESQSVAWRLPSNVQVAPGASLTVSLPLKGPGVPGLQSISETFQLTLDGTTRFGPADSELKVTMQVSAGSGTFMVEPRAGGLNTAWYSDIGMAYTGADCTLGTPDIGMRYGSTYRSVAGLKQARWYPNFPARAFYRIYVAWGAGTSRQNPITYNVRHRSGVSSYNLNQAATANEWIQIGSQAFEFDAGQNQQGVEMTNQNIDVSGNMYAGPVSFEFVGTSSVNDWSLY